MSSEVARKQEVELPFIAEIVMALISLAATYLYFRDLLLPMGALVLFGVVVLRRNTWAISAAILMALVVDLYHRQREDELQIALLLLVAGVLLQLLAAFWERRRLGYWGSSFTENAIFATLGLIIGYAIQFRICQPAVGDISASGLLYVWTSLVGCSVAVAVEPIVTFTPTATTLPEMIVPKPGMETLSPAFFSALGLVCLRTIFLTPGFWAMFMAGFRASGLAIWNPGRVLGHTIRALLGTQVVGILALLILVGLAAVDLYLRSSDITAYSAVINLSILITLLLTMILGAGWGAGRGR